MQQGSGRCLADGPVDFVVMGSEKRARQKANRAEKLAQQEIEETKVHREESTKKWGRIAAVVGGIIALIMLISFLRGGDDEPAQFSVNEEPTAVIEREPVVLADAVPDDFEPFAGTKALATVAPAARADAYASPPPMTIDTAKTYVAVIDTDAGDISFELYPAESPATVNNFVNLARDGFYDGVTFHRVIEGFMAQGGDPTGTGLSGPGYSFADEVDNGLAMDRRGLLAMANAGPDTNGSQFFITFEAANNLTGKHSIFGEVTRNEDVLDSILRRDPDAGGPATIINAIRILES